MNHEHLRSFVAFADRLNFTHAAHRLHISQPALHVQIRKLAEAVGRPLYVRHGRALALTPEGERLAAFGREVETRSRAVLAEVRGERDDAPVVFASGHGAYLHLLGPSLRRFGRTGRLRLLVLPGAEAVEAVRAARADLAVAAVEVAGDHRELVAEPLREVGQVAVLPRDHRLARRRRLSPRDLDGEPLVVAPAGGVHRAALAHAFAGAGAALVVAVEASGWDLMMQLAGIGAGVTVVNDVCRVPAGLIGVPLDGVPAVTYRMVSRRDAVPSPAATALRATLRAMLRP